MAEQNTRSGGYTSFSDMFDGGGPGASGGPFKGGGLLSAVGNALTGNRGMGVGPEAGVGFAGYGYNDAGGNWVPAYIDMRNGGGPGMAGPTFQGGGHYSALANMLGIRPMGYNDTMDAGGYNPVSAPRNPAIAPLSSPTPAPRPAPNNSGATPVSAYVPTALPPNALPQLSSVSRMANDPFIGLDLFLNAPTVPSVRGVNAPLVSGDPNLTALRTYLAGS